ncbi:MAG: DNA translocase FtsK [bacterium]|nr:DNA translocase FtsK [bacterium]
MSKKKLNTDKTKNKADEKKDTEQSRELWAVITVLTAAFVFVSNHFMDTTGFIGYWVVNVYLKKIVGDGVFFLPLFLIMLAFAFLFSRTKWKSSLTTAVIFFATFTILLEIIHKTPVYTLSWPLQVSRGGWIGTIGYFCLYKITGYYGTVIFLCGTFIISSILMFNFSLKKICIAFYKLIIKQLDSDKELLKTGNTAREESLARKVCCLLFFKKVKAASDVTEKISKKRSDILKPGKEQKLKFKLPEFPEISLSEPEIEQEKEPRFVEPSKNPEQYHKEQSYKLPPLNLLDKGNSIKKTSVNKNVKQKESALILEDTLMSFNVKAKVVHVSAGPSVTRYELQPGSGVKISKITSLARDIALKLAAPDIRIEAPIPGKALVGIEVPNSNVDTITLRTIIDKTDFIDTVSRLNCAMGLTITGEPVLMNLVKMPHLLIAGATGSGKSVCINAIILSILLKAKPEDVKFLMIDPKKVELSLYDDIPHLLAPVVTDPSKAAATLKKWALHEMERRYEEFSKAGVKNIEGYNARVAEMERENKQKSRKSEEAEKDSVFVPPKLPYIIVIIDELADLMMVASQEVENTICRLAQMARATGIHLVIATQRPSVNVITGLIKANVPSRISFFLQSQIDSRTILDMPGAEKLLGKGDMLYSPVGIFKPRRLQGVFVSEAEVKRIVEFIRNQQKPNYLNEIVEIEPLSKENKQESLDREDDLFDEARELVINSKYASTSYLQRKLRIGYNRAARIMDELEKRGVISEYAGEKKPRSVI